MTVHATLAALLLLAVAARAAQPPPLRLAASGWLKTPHSYALVLQCMLLELASDAERVQLSFTEVAPYRASWNDANQRDLHPPADEATLAALQSRAVADVELRASFPLELGASSTSAAVLVLATAEYGRLNSMAVRHNSSALPAFTGTLLTPSRWSAQGLAASGAPAGRIALLPHGIRASVFHPLSRAARESLRRRLDCDGRFVLLNVGAVTGNKRVATIITALQRLLALAPALRGKVLLIVKGQEQLYHSLSRLPPAAQALAQAGSLRYVGDTLSIEEMAQLYQVADAYVTPYSAEGFNLPALEAAAAGLPVLATSGGPTDDFLHAALHMRLPSRIVDKNGAIERVVSAEDVHAAVHQLLHAQQRRYSRLLRFLHVAARWTWSAVAAQLLQIAQAAAAWQAQPAGRAAAHAVPRLRFLRPFPAIVARAGSVVVQCAHEYDGADSTCCLALHTLTPPQRIPLGCAANCLFTVQLPAGALRLHAQLRIADEVVEEAELALYSSARGVRRWEAACALADAGHEDQAVQLLLDDVTSPDTAVKATALLMPTRAPPTERQRAEVVAAAKAAVQLLLDDVAVGDVAPLRFFQMGKQWMQRRDALWFARAAVQWQSAAAPQLLQDDGDGRGVDSVPAVAVLVSPTLRRWRWLRGALAASQATVHVVFASQTFCRAVQTEVASCSVARAHDWQAVRQAVHRWRTPAVVVLPPATHSLHVLQASFTRLAATQVMAVDGSSHICRLPVPRSVDAVWVGETQPAGDDGGCGSDSQRVRIVWLQQ